jgi:signal transduction histidine kinase
MAKNRKHRSTTDREIQLETQIDAVRRESRDNLGNLAHQLSAPVGAIKWTVEAMKRDGALTARSEALLTELCSQTTRLERVIKNITLFSDVEDNAVRFWLFPRAMVNLQRVVTNVVDEFRQVSAEGDKKIEVDGNSFNRVLGNEPLFVIEDLVTQAFSNLLENAVKYGDPETTILITCSRRQGYAQISVQSTGIPMEPEDIREITKRRYRGT